MDVNVLSGDSLVENFKKTGIDGEMIVCRECFVDGDLSGGDLEEFWATREKFLNSAYSTGEDAKYQEKVTDEFVRLWNLADGNAVNLWFEYELFCQVNLWFTIWLLRNSAAEFYLVYPPLQEENRWSGFGSLDSDGLKNCFAGKMRINDDDLYLGVQLWEAFQKRDFETLRSLGERESKGFPTLNEVCEAACEIETRPAETLRQIVAEGKSSFGEAFGEFSRIEGVYGFGDLQVKRIFDDLDAK
ncbi:MAG: DUF1835 domain-containing protein [Acidobacteria bacterium]|nr:DUF1835 domain-containing protein [Acidobacteriota bacterium]